LFGGNWKTSSIPAFFVDLKYLAQLQRNYFSVKGLTMKAAIVVEAGKVETWEIPEPEPGPYQALVEVLACGFCNGTDSKVVEGHWPGLPDFPYILGHETVSRVVSLGKKVRNLKIGQLVLQARVEGYAPKNIGTAWGGFVEYALATDWQAILDDGLPLPIPFFKTQQIVPADMNVLDAVMLITMKEVYSALESFGVPANREVLVCGDGPVGITIASVARQLGAAEVILCGHHSDRLELARKFGATQTINTKQGSLVKQLKEKYPAGIPLIIDAIGNNQIIQDGLDLVAPEGKIGVYGYSDQRQTSIDWSRAPVQWSIEYLVVPKLDRLLAAHDPLVGWIMNNRVAPKEMVTHVLPLQEAQKAYDLVKSREALKVVMDMQQKA
jgi:threonine dehydrogenase-like Zn-dependent dehydrogenase